MRRMWGIGLALALALVGVGPGEAFGRESGWVRVEGTTFQVSGAETPGGHHFLGTNFWAAMNLGADPALQARLSRELDRLAALGVKNLRILAVSEGPDSEPWRIVPALQPAPGQVREELWLGLDRVLAELEARGMKAVLCLGNFWPWSGGFGQYLAWSGAGAIPYPPPQEGGDWGVYQSYVERFYSNERAVALYRETVRKLVTRVNRVTGRAYRDDPTIFSWQLANEPRGGRNVADFQRWIRSTSALIKGLDPRHLVTTGSEGETPWPQGSGLNLVEDHSSADVDYATAHVWAQNWGWFDPARVQETYGPAVARMREYVSRHATLARKLGKPLVFEEFGLGRDGGSHDPVSATQIRDRYYADFFAAVYAEARAGAVGGVNFWAWSGEGRPVGAGGGIWLPGHPFTGDPPHEHQGWYGVYDRDTSTLAVIQDWVSRFRELR